LVVTNANQHHQHQQHIKINEMPHSSLQASSTSLAIGRLPRLKTQSKYLDELAAEIIL
jgi:hypothetical protein